MTTISVSLSEERWRLLQEKAAQHGVSPEELARISIEEMLNVNADDEPKLEHSLDGDAATRQFDA